MGLLTVARDSKPKSVAGAMADSLRRDGVVEVRGIGPGAVYQAVKAIAICQGFVASSGLDLVCEPEFVTLELENGERTAIRFMVTSRPAAPLPLRRSTIGLPRRPDPSPAIEAPGPGWGHDLG